MEQGGAGAFCAESAAVVVARPEDESLWAGGLMLMHHQCDWWVVTLCRGSDPDRVPRFGRALEALGAAGAMGDLDDGPDQAPLSDDEVRGAVLALLGGRDLDLVVTHGPEGEYTRHRRHEQASRAVGALWREGRLGAGALWMFAYEDGGGRYLPRARTDAHRSALLGDRAWRLKRDIVTGLYGFGSGSFEARATPRVEAFWCFERPADYEFWLAQRG
jgi:LmbE family N-acetylglucosaminyl deacetylase